MAGLQEAFDRVGTALEHHLTASHAAGAALAISDRITLLTTSAFLWSKRDLGTESDGLPRDVPWLVFCSPPYAFFHEKQAEMLDLIGRIRDHSPVGSILLVEADDPFDFELLRPTALNSDSDLARDVQHGGLKRRRRING